MALTPYPSLATLPETIINGGKIPAHMIDVFAARTIYASSIPGVALDCDLFTGAKVGGGIPTDNAAKINAVLATASASNPLHLIIDGGCALGKALLIPTTGYVTITGHGWNTGFYMLPGANSNAIQNVAGTDLASSQAWNSGIGGQSIVGKNVTLRDFRLHCNRGTYPNGNCNGGRDGTFPGYSGSSPDARGSYPDNWLLTGIMLVGVENLAIDNVWVYDAPTFHIDLYHCQKVVIDRCRIEAGDPTVPGNTDGVHCNGGCSQVRISNTWFSTGDDAIGINLEEGDGSDGADFIVDNCVLSNCLNAGRIYAFNVSNSRRVSITNVRGTCQNSGFNIGYEGAASTQAECNHSVYIGNCEIQLTNPNFRNAMVWINSHAGVVEVSHCKFVEPSLAIPLVMMNRENPTVSSLRIVDCSIHRNSSGSAAAYAFEGSTGTVGDLVIQGFSVTEQSGQSYADIPALVDLNGTAVGRLTIDADVKGIARVVNITSSSTVGSVVVKDLVHRSNNGSPTAYSIVAAGSTVPVSVGRYSGANLAGLAGGTVSLTGPGLISSGFSFADGLIANGTIYNSSTQGALAYKGGAGGVSTFNMTASGTLAPGAATAGPATASTAAATSTDASGGTAPYAYQWYRSTSSGTLGAAIPGQATRTLADTGLTPSTTYYYTLKYIDSTSATVYSNQVAGTTGAAGVTTYLNDNFAGTAGANLTGHVPNTQNGSDVWGGGLSEGAMVLAQGGGATSSGATSNWSADYQLTGVGGVGTYNFTFTNGVTSAFPTFYLRADAGGGLNNLVAVVANYSLQRIELLVISGGTVTVNTNYPQALTIGAIETLAVTLASTTVSATLNGTSIFSGIAIPASSNSHFYIRQQQGSAGDVKFASVTVHS